MKPRTFILILAVAACAALFLADAPGWGAKGGIPGKPTPTPTPDPSEPTPTPTPTPVPGNEPLYFWRLGHMDGPHDASYALGISRDGKTAVGATDVVDFFRGWRCDIEWAIATDDGVPPLYNELQVQEDIGVVAPSQYSAAFAASDMTYEPITYDLPNLQLDWGGSTTVGTLDVGEVSYGTQWLFAVKDSVDEGDYVTIPDFGGGATDMAALDVTPDGVIMVGYGHNKRGPLAFRADMTDPLLPVVRTLTITDSVYTEQTLQGTVAEAVSADGMIIAGYGGTKRGNRAFVTTVVDASTDPITLLSVVLPNIDGGQWAEAYAMTPDGAIIAGRSDSPKGPQACIWWQDATTAEWLVKPLGGLSKKKLDSVATGVAYKVGSDAGDLMVVGRSQSILYDSEAFVWTGNPVLEDDGIGYIYDLEYILIKTGAAEISGMGSMWILNEATGVSALGDRIVGWGINPEGGVEAWLVTGFPFHTPEFTHE
jgi:uncharacterized membrane protein